MACLATKVCALLPPLSTVSLNSVRSPDESFGSLVLVFTDYVSSVLESDSDVCDLVKLFRGKDMLRLPR